MLLLQLVLVLLMLLTLQVFVIAAVAAAARCSVSTVSHCSTIMTPSHSRCIRDIAAHDSTHAHVYGDMWVDSRGGIAIVNDTVLPSTRTAQRTS